MILGFDVGNTHISPFIYDNNEIIKKWRIETKYNYTEDTFFSILKPLFEYENIDISKITDVVISSVVPNVNNMLIYLSNKYFNISPKYVSLKHLVNTHIFIEGGVDRGLGADRIVDILAAQKQYPDKYLIIIDFGTATTFEIIYNKKYLGGAILPGIDLSIDALFMKTAKLPKVIFRKPNTPLANNTIDQINAGIYYSNIGSIKELIKEYKKIYPESFVIATGGQGEEISRDLKDIDLYDPLLGEKGIIEFYNILKSRNE